MAGIGVRQRLGLAGWEAVQADSAELKINIYKLLLKLKEINIFSCKIIKTHTHWKRE